MSSIEELYEQMNEENRWDKVFTLKRNQYLCVAGSIETHLFYIETGSVKISILDDCEEHIIRFGYQQNFIAALDSFITEKPTQFYIQALKKTEIKSITKAQYIDFIQAEPERSKMWEILQQQLILQQLEREIDILTTSPKERYLRVLKRSPQLFQEIPNKHIASYLRMSPETLSRLKNS